MTWREKVGWGLVAADSLGGVAAAALKGGTFEALTAAGTALMGAAAAWGYTSRRYDGFRIWSFSPVVEIVKSR